MFMVACESRRMQVLCFWRIFLGFLTNRLYFIAPDDDGGGFYDHVTPPSEGVPNPDQGCQVPAGCSGHPEFDFKRLGIRVTSYVISPWIPKNLAIQRPTGPQPTSQFDLTSNIATAKNLFGLDSFLTKRDAWAGSLTELLTLDEPRDDCPLHFPEAPPPAAPWTAPGTTNTETDLRRLAARDDATEPQHCSAQRQVCEGSAAVTERQKRLIRKLANYFPGSAPDMEDITFAEVMLLLPLFPASLRILTCNASARAMPCARGCATSSSTMQFNWFRCFTYACRPRSGLRSTLASGWSCLHLLCCTQMSS